MQDIMQFQNEVTDLVNKSLNPKSDAAGYVVRTRDFVKNNGVTAHAVEVRPKDSRIGTNIYVDDMYHDGVPAQVAARLIMDQVKSDPVFMKDNIDLDFFTDFEKAKELISFRLVNAERNSELLENAPHMDYLDLAAMYQCNLPKEFQRSLPEGSQSNEKGLYSILITNNHMATWGVTEADLREAAYKNMARFCEPVARSLNDIMQEETGMGLPFDPGMIVAHLKEDAPFGATVLLNKEFLEEMSEKLGGDMMVIPSSIHEIILVPIEMSGPGMNEMVQQVNADTVDEREVLSDQAYFYDSASKELVSGYEWEERQAGIEIE